MSAKQESSLVVKTRSGLVIPDFDVLVPHPLVTRVNDLLCSAFEGGSNYWYALLEPHKFPEGYTFKDVGEDGRLQPEHDYWHWSTLLSLVPGGTVKFRILEDIPWEPGKEPPTCPLNYKAAKDGNSATVFLHRMAIERGLKVFASLAQGKGGHHYPNWLQENDDAETGDVFLQCCCFGEIIYG